MDFSQFHFENNTWLWGIAAIPSVWLLYALFYKGSGATQQLERFADKHLLPHLLKDRQGEKKNLWLPLSLWSLAWACGLLAMAGPRWNYTDVQAFKPEKDLVIVLDLSTSMNAQDVKPSRIVQARERIEDLLNMSHGMTIGLVAYAAVPHMVAPLTDDTQTIDNLLPAIDTSLVTVQGDRLKPALEMASRMLDAEPGNSKSILVISAGNFEESDMSGLAEAATGATIYTMGVGTAEGAPIADDNGGWVKDQDGKMLIAKLQADRLQALAAAGHGFYIEESYADNGLKTILGHINGMIAQQETAHKNVRIWQERFYIPALGLALLLLPLFRKRYVFPVVVFLAVSFSAPHAEAASWMDLFLNSDQQGQKDYNQGDYQGAMEKFSAPYQHGVAAYKAGEYDKAAQSFKAANGLQAEYNLGNAELMQGKPEDAITSYETVLKQNPDDKSAKHNLEIAKKLLEQQKQQQSQEGSDQKKDDKQDQKDQKESAQNQQQKNEQNSQSQPQKDREQSAQQKQAAQSQQNKTGDKKDRQQAKNEQSSQQQTAAQKQQQSSAQAAQSQAQKEQEQEKQDNTASSASAQPQDQQEQTASDTHPRTQLDINADQWLDRIQNDPGSFLKNQFMIEDRESGLQ